MLATILCCALAMAEPLRLPDVLAEVEARAPVVEVAAHDVAVVEAEIGATGTWQDPMVSFATSGVPLPGRARPPMGTMLIYGVEQTFNTLGRRRPAKREARARVGVARQRLRRSQWDVKADAVALFVRLWAIDSMRAIYLRQIAALEQTREAALAMYRAGLPGGHHDVLRAEAEALAVQASIASLDDERIAAAAMLNALRGRDASTPIDAVELPPRVLPPRLAPALALHRSSPEVLEARAETRVSRERKRVVRGTYLPMITAGAQYEQRLFGMPDSFAGMISLSLPLWSFDNRRRELDVANAMQRRAEQRMRATETMIAAEVRVSWSRAQAANRRLDVLEREAIPRMQETLVASRNAYIAGTGEFLALLDTTLALQRLEEQRIDATVALHEARFEIERVLGVALEQERAR